MRSPIIVACVYAAPTTDATVEGRGEALPLFYLPSLGYATRTRVSASCTKTRIQAIRLSARREQNNSMAAAHHIAKHVSKKTGELNSDKAAVGQPSAGVILELLKE